MSLFGAFSQKMVEKLPFQPNLSQQKLIGMLSSFVLGTEIGLHPESSFLDREKVFVLRGYAGTGKTSIIGALVKTMSELKMRTALMAPTGRAAKVFSFMSDFPAFTIHKCIYRQQKFSVDMEGFNLMNNLHPSTLFICDEASMIATLSESSSFGTGNLLDDLIEFVYSATGCRLLLVGDDAQLPPVGQPHSPALDVRVLKGYGLDVLEFQLTEVARQQSDSGILCNATMLRKQISEGKVDQLPRLLYKNFADVRRIDGYDFLECLETSYRRQGTDDTIIITRSNARANRFNQGVRNRILEREEEISAGDRLMVVKNNYYWGREYEQIPFVANGDVLEVKRVISVVELYGFRFAEVSVSFPDYEVDMDLVVMLDTIYSEGPNLPVSRQQELFSLIAEDYPEIRSQKELVKTIKENKYFNALQVKFAYAVTCHKSQGGQWSDVYLDLGYVNPEHLGLDFYRWLYTAFTRAVSTLYLVNPSDDILE